MDGLLFRRNHTSDQNTQFMVQLEYTNDWNSHSFGKAANLTCVDDGQLKQEVTTRHHSMSPIVMCCRQLC